MNITRQIKITIINENEDIRKEQYKFIRDSIYAQYRGLNMCMGYLLSGYYANNMDIKSEGFKLHQKTITNSLSIFNDIEFGKGIDSKSSITQRIKKDFSTALKNGLAKGERSGTNYKRDYPLMTRGRDLKFKYENDNSDTVIINWVNKIVFKCIIGHKGNSTELKHTLHKVINGEYKVGGSSIGFNKRNEMILNLSLDIPEKKHKVVEGRTLGVDVGLAIPAYVSLNDSIYVRKGFGCYDEFARVRQQFKARKSRLYKQRELTKGGNGRKKKLHSLDFLASKESDFAKTYNHQLSRKIVDFAVKNNCQYINIENINSETLDDKLLAQWGYYQLQEQITYKAKLVGIEVRKVRSAYTSQTCSFCGNVDKENRPKKDKGQAYFSCTNPKCPMHGKVINADWNASVNIARSNKFEK